MASYDSTQYADTLAKPASRLKPNEWGGRVRRSWWDFTTPAGGLTVGDTVNLVTLPRGARVLGGRVGFGDMTTGGGTATAEIGYAGAASRYAGALNVDAAGESDFADTAARNFGDELDADRTILATVGGEDWAAAQSFTGYIEWMRD